MIRIAVSMCFQLRTVATSLGRSMVARSLPWSWCLWNGWKKWTLGSPKGQDQRQWRNLKSEEAAHGGIGDHLRVSVCVSHCEFRMYRLERLQKRQVLVDANSDILLALNSSLLLWHINWIIPSWGWMMEDPALSSEARPESKQFEQTLKNWTTAKCRHIELNQMNDVVLKAKNVLFLGMCFCLCVFVRLLLLFHCLLLFIFPSSLYSFFFRLHCTASRRCLTHFSSFEFRLKQPSDAPLLRAKKLCSMLFDFIVLLMRTVIFICLFA